MKKWMIMLGVLGGLLLVIRKGNCADNIVLFGLNVPLSGSYASQGEEQLRSYKLAIEKINERGGVLGKRIHYAVKDTQTDAEVARENVKELIREGAIMITGGISSPASIAQCEECQKAGIVFMAGSSYSSEITGIEAHRHCIRWYNNGYQTARIISQAVLNKFGPHGVYASLYNDSPWGNTVQKLMREAIGKARGAIVLEIPTEPGRKSFLSSLLEVKKAKPDVLILIHFGTDMINCLKQAYKLRFHERMEFVVPLMELNMAYKLGPEILQGIMTSMPWYHGLSEQFEGSAQFVKVFEEEYHKKPGNSAAAAWVNIFQYVDAVERAGTFEPGHVIKALEGHRFTLLGNEEYWRDWDHQGIHPAYVAIGKTPEESKHEWDLFHIIDSQPGEKLSRTKEENPVQLEPLEFSNQ
jgi:ABC-type branched-subunit amino acid transport system substrate-binding protein